MSPRRKKNRYAAPRCNDCNALITFKNSPITGNPRPFDPKPVDGRTHVGPAAYPVESGRAWRFEEFVDELRVRHQQTHDDAVDEAYAFPWFVPHQCPTGTTSESEHQQ